MALAHYRTVLLLLGVLGLAAGCSGSSEDVVQPVVAAPRVAFDGVVSERSVAPTIFGANAQIVGRFTWADVQLRTRLRELALGTLRFPGGTNANYWDWRAGWYVADGQPIPDLPPGTPVQPLTLSDFAGAIAATGARPMWVLNMLTSSDPEQLAMLRAARGLSLDVDRIELGNELYFSGLGPRGPDYARRFPSGSEYGVAARVLIDSLRAAFGPGPRIAVLGDALQSATPLTDPRRLGWNTAMLAAVAPHRPAVTLHHYLDTRAVGDVGGLLAATARQWETLRAGPVAAIGGAGHRLWITEFNLAEAGTWAGTWAHALSLVLSGVLMLEEPTIDEIQVHNVVGGARFGLLFSSTADFGAAGPATRPYDLTAPGVAFATLPWLVAGSDRCGRLRGVGAPSLVGTAADAVRAYRCRGAGGGRILVLNLTGERVVVGGALLAGAAGSADVVSSAVPASPVSVPADLQRARVALVDGGLAMPAWSIARLELP